MERGAWRGLVDLKEVLEGGGVVVERERCVRDEAWVGTLSLVG